MVPLDPVQINLAEGHYLRLGISLQLTAEAHEVDGSLALDAAIQVFSGRTAAELANSNRREALRSRLVERLDGGYDGDVMGVYFTEFVTE
ncbi:flagellar basal body-associated FliL family protein [Nocardioides sp. TF02-7]|uniref:flagellar basal body-associated FliL family protein n=1 Tax=Nocardioides sp. TF02-7 TaxID=2917724 RepID=UPI001F0598C9|nr:flagellar basal body-associated FliL family protein [Nocardioides sp. TF02-7]UMG92968.1 flagellar basal body-associated FliL family protein [Nocardioides sp. TF02-7]